MAAMDPWTIRNSIWIQPSHCMGIGSLARDISSADGTRKKDGSGTQYSDYNPIYNIANAGEVVDLYAQWTPNTYTVYFYSGGTGSGGGSSRSFTYDQAQNLPNPADVGISSINGTFTSWNTEYDGSGTSYQAGQSVKNLTADEYGSIYLYAQWKTTHTVHFRAYNATPEYFEDQRVADGDSATKPTDPVRPGFVFRGVDHRQ